MKTSLIRGLVILIAILGVAAFVFFDSTRISSRFSNGSIPQSPPPEPEEGRAPLFNPDAYPVPSGAMEEAWRASMRAVAPEFDPQEAPAAPDHWASIGPAPINGGQYVANGEQYVETPTPFQETGRIIDIAVDPSQPTQHWFIAADLGGIWETTNGGNSWFPRSDGEISLTMNTITIAPGNPKILFASTRGFDASLLKSINGGASWTMLPSLFSSDAGYSGFASVKVHPTDPNIVLVMTSQSNNQTAGGVFRSTNGGASFCHTLPGAGTALQVSPANFNQQYAAVGNTPGQNGIYRSPDGGESWTQLAGPWDPSMATGKRARIGIGPQTTPGRVYVVVVEGGIWTTQDAWAPTPTWVNVAAPGINHFTATDFVVVDPSIPSTFYIGGQGHYAFYRVNADGTFAYILPTTHLDQHAMAAVAVPGSTAPPTLLLGSDGGFFTSANRGASWTNRNSNLATVQFYAGALHPSNPNAALGGAQDNGTESWHGNNLWEFRWYGDGAYCAFSYTDPDHTWLVQEHRDFGPEILKYTVGSTVGPPYAGPLAFDGSHIATAPVIRSPNSNVVLAGSTSLWKSADFFTAVPPASPTWTINGPPAESSPVTAIAFAPSSAALTYAFGTLSGALWLTVNAGGEQAIKSAGPWKNLDPSAGMVPNRRVNAIAFHPTNPAIIYVALGDFSPPGPIQNIFKTTNATTAPTPTWENVSPPVNSPMNALAIDPLNPNTIYAGAELGIWKSTDAGVSWTFMGPGSGMPNVKVKDLHFSPAPDYRLVAFTFGRGAFRLNAGPESGSLQVNITPAAASNSGAQWRVDGGVYQNSGTTLAGLSTGIHTVAFKSINGYTTPANQSVQINATQTTISTGGYSAPVIRIANLATRLRVGTGENVLIGGFTMLDPGGAAKQIALRGMGPSVPVSENLEDPYIELHDASGTTLARNDNWADASNSNQIPPYLVPTDSRESVILTTLGPGAYTVILKGANDETGVGLFEAYDLQPTSATRLVNISTRGYVQKADDVMIGGFILSGPAGSAMKVLVRGLGPSVPVGEHLEDPYIELHGPDGGLLVSNDDWEDAPNSCQIPSNLSPGNSRESAILTTLGPGQYTVVIKGAHGESGVALFEAYQLED